MAFIHDSEDHHDGAVAVMVVDDSAAFRETAGALVDATPGFALVARAASGAEALAVARTRPVDLVMMDVRMPGMDGLEATRRLVRAHPETVVVLVSVDEPVAAAATCGAAAFMAKQDLGPRMLRSLWTRHGRPRR